METLKNLLTLLGSLALVLLALVLLVLVTPFAFVWKVYVSFKYENRKAREIVQGTAQFFIAIASSLDKFGNCAFGGFLNAVLIKEGYYKFGKNHETISEVLGWAERYNDLAPPGNALLTVLNWLDRDHCRKAMLSGVQRSRSKIELFNELNPL